MEKFYVSPGDNSPGLKAFIGESMERLHIFDQHRSAKNFEEFARQGLREIAKRWINVLPESGITTDENAWPWLGGIEYEMVDEGQGFPDGTPEILVELFRAAQEARDRAASN